MSEGEQAYLANIIDLMLILQEKEKDISMIIKQLVGGAKIP